MSRIAQRFAELKAAGRKALIPFITAGDPNPEVTVPAMHALVAAGADVIELGVPFSDPMVDGPVIQKASERALVHHVSLRKVLQMVREFRQTDNATPVVLMGYLNPIEVMGYAAFAEQAAAAGVDGALTVDLPPEEAGEFIPRMREHGLDPIFLIAPTTTEARVQRIAGVASGFVYYVSVKGITGASHLDVTSVAEKLGAIRAHTELPVGVGFGIKDAASAAAVGQVADAVIVGSAVVNIVAGLAERPQEVPAALGKFVGELRAALDA